MPYKDPVQRQKYLKGYNAKYRKNLKQHAYDSITSGGIIDQPTWDLWCNENKRKAAANNRPYSEDFTNDIIFEMMVQGCFYCGDIATSIDRIDSKLEHTPKNCIGSCYGCNVSKGAADPDTFVRKAYYRARKTYYDDYIDIWYVHKQKPRVDMYNRKGVSFELTENEWNKLVVGECAYCHRSPATWFGVDRIDPLNGYVSDNAVSCCWDCNNDKAEDDVDTMRERNERIAQRMDASELVISKCEKVILHMNHKKQGRTCIIMRLYH